MQIDENKREFAEETKSTSKKTLTTEKSLKKEIFEWMRTIVIALVVVLFIHNFVFTFVRVDGPSMKPTLANNDRLIVWRLGYEPQNGDIVVFDAPSEYEESAYWIKRIIATEGQHVEIDYSTNSVYVDGQKIDEPYLGEPMVDKGGNTLLTEIDVPENCVFVLGDNRNNSTDGRFIGPVNKDKLVGKAVLRFWPFTEVETY